MVFKTKIIFLDIDGVLRTHKSDLEWSKKLTAPVYRGVNRLFDKELVDNLNEVIILTGAKIVVTSNWRIHLSLEELQKIFKDRGVIGEVIGKTGLGHLKDGSPIPIGNRGLEISDWLGRNPAGKFIIIDDQVSDIINIFPSWRIIKVNPQVGFVEVEKALDVLL
jgi:hypothetical protein